MPRRCCTTCRRRDGRCGDCRRLLPPDADHVHERQRAFEGLQDLGQPWALASGGVSVQPHHSRVGLAKRAGRTDQSPPGIVAAPNRILVGTFRAGTQVAIAEGVVTGTKASSLTVNPSGTYTGPAPFTGPVVAGSLSVAVNRTVTVNLGPGAVRPWPRIRMSLPYRALLKVQGSRSRRCEWHRVHVHDRDHADDPGPGRVVCARGDLSVQLDADNRRNGGGGHCRLGDLRRTVYATRLAEPGRQDGADADRGRTTSPRSRSRTAQPRPLPLQATTTANRPASATAASQLRQRRACRRSLLR